MKNWELELFLTKRDLAIDVKCAADIPVCNSEFQQITFSLNLFELSFVFASITIFRRSTIKGLIRDIYLVLCSKTIPTHRYIYRATIMRMTLFSIVAQTTERGGS